MAMSKKKIEAAVQQAFNAKCCNKPIPIMMIPKIWKVGEAAIIAGETIEQAGEKMAKVMEVAA